MTVPFKKCPACNSVWDSREGFLSDPDLKIIGYQVDFINLTEGLFYFSHSCKGTLAMAAGDFADLYGGPIFAERVTGSYECPIYCQRKDDLTPCPVECECAYVREIIQIVRNWRKDLKT